MDTTSLIKNLNEVFCNNNKAAERKYSEVWLREVDMGGLYNNGKFTLCVKALHNIDSCKNEIDDILKMLNDRAKDALAYIWTVRVYNADDQIHCESSDLKIYDEISSCL